MPSIIAQHLPYLFVAAVAVVAAFDSGSVAVDFARRLYFVLAVDFLKRKLNYNACPHL